MMHMFSLSICWLQQSEKALFYLNQFWRINIIHMFSISVCWFRQAGLCRGFHELGQPQDLLLQGQLVEEDHLGVDGILNQVLDWPHRQHLVLVLSAHNLNTNKSSWPASRFYLWRRWLAPIFACTILCQEGDLNVSLVYHKNYGMQHNFLPRFYWSSPKWPVKLVKKSNYYICEDRFRSICLHLC